MILGSINVLQLSCLTAVSFKSFFPLHICVLKQSELMSRSLGASNRVHGDGILTPWSHLAQDRNSCESRSFHVVPPTFPSRRMASLRGGELAFWERSRVSFSGERTCVSGTAKIIRVCSALCCLLCFQIELRSDLRSGRETGDHVRSARSDASEVAPVERSETNHQPSLDGGWG